LAGRSLKVVILAAGQGTRMKSDLPKVLHPVAGRPILGYVVDAARALGPERTSVVVGYQADRVLAYLAEGFPGLAFASALQVPQKGTGHALLVAREAIGGEEADLLLLYGDTPLVKSETLTALLDHHRSSKATATILAAVVADPSGYGRIIRDEATGTISHIVEDRDATPAQRAVREVNCGIYCFRVPDIFPLLDQLTADNRQEEFYLVDIVSLILRQGGLVTTLTAVDPEEVEGVNSRVQLARAEARKRGDILTELMRSGVTVVDPASTFVDWGVEVGRDTILEPGAILRGRTKIGTGCVIGPWSHLDGAIIADDCRVWASVVEDSAIRPGASVGPFSRIRPGTTLEAGVQVGNFAEVKNSTIGARTKIHHHSYIGDADVGPDVNIGAGTVVVNYDGLKKHRTQIGQGAFIGCNSNLVAPIKIGDGAYTAAGTTVTADVPPGHLAVGRTRQSNLAGWVERRRSGTVSAEAAQAAKGTDQGRTGKREHSGGEG